MVSWARAERPGTESESVMTDIPTSVTLDHVEALLWRLVPGVSGDAVDQVLRLVKAYSATRAQAEAQRVAELEAAVRCPHQGVEERLRRLTAAVMATSGSLRLVEQQLAGVLGEGEGEGEGGEDAAWLDALTVLGETPGKPAGVSEQQCTRCHLVKRAIEFTKDKHRSNGLRGQCKKCVKEAKEERALATAQQAAEGTPGVPAADATEGATVQRGSQRAIESESGAGWPSH